MDVLVKGNLQDMLLSSDLDRLLGLEGASQATSPPPGSREGGAERPLRAAGSARHREGRDRPRHLPQRGRRTDRPNALHAGRQAEKEAAQTNRQSTASRSPGPRQRRSEQARRGSQQAHARTLRPAARAAGGRVRPHRAPQAQRSELRLPLVFDNTAKLPGTPKQRFAYLFPGREAALISVRMRAGLSEAQRTRTIALIRRAVAMPQWRLQHGEHYLITGEPVIVADLTSSITHAIELLLVAVLLVMALTLGLVFRGRPRLLPLALAVLATALTFGALAAVGASLTVAQVAVLPVLVGLAVDYAIQFQSRFQEVRAERERRTPGAVRRAAAVAGPTIAAAAAAGGAALLVLALSPVPTVRGFGLLLVVGILIAFLCVLTVDLRCSRSRSRGRRAARGRGFRGRRTPAARAPWILSRSRRRALRVLLARRARAAARECAYPPGLAGRTGARGAPPRSRARRRSGARRARLGARHADPRRNQPRKARPPEHGFAAQPRCARAHLRRRRRNRSDGLGQKRRDPRDDRMDERLRGSRPAPFRLLRHARLRQGAAVPGLLAARPLRGGAIGGGAATGSASGPVRMRRPGASRRRQAAPRRNSPPPPVAAVGDPVVLLPGRDHRRPAGARSRSAFA